MSGPMARPRLTDSAEPPALGPIRTAHEGALTEAKAAGCSGDREDLFWSQAWASIFTYTRLMNRS